MVNSFPGIVAYPPNQGSSVWKLSKISLDREIRNDELVIRMVATGICHTDIYTSQRAPGELGIAFPKILGHEGAGVVEAVGNKVTTAKPGDLVILSHNHCMNCKECLNGPPSKCASFTKLNVIGEAATFMDTDGIPIHGKFFGQSSFAAFSIVDERSVVNVTGLVTQQELKILAPLGCGLQTGVGAILNVGKPKKGDGVMITGLGAVGLGAVMAAKLAGCSTIVAIDRVPSRLEMAKSLGATHILNTSNGTDLIEQVQRTIENQSISVAIETTASMEIIRESVRCLERWGRLILIGAPSLDATITLPMSELFFGHKTITSSVLGNGDKTEAIPLMISWWKQGLFPVEKIVKFYSAETEMEDAVKGMEGSAVIKPVLVW